MGFNLVGLRRLGVDNKQIMELKKVYDNIFNDKETFQQRITNIKNIDNPLVEKVVNFLKAQNDRAFLSPNNN